jgi:hypothetical protein
MPIAAALIGVSKGAPIKKALEKAGVKFTNGRRPGVKLKSWHPNWHPTRWYQ